MKEYYENGQLLFEGDYLNGKGKEYNNRRGELIFEGEYLNGIKWNGKKIDENKNIIYEIKEGRGFIKEFALSKILEFEGFYINGQLNGKGKEYNIVGQLVFEGEYFNGKSMG